MKPSTIVFTAVSNNYLHFARTLMESVGASHPEWRRVVLLVDIRTDDLDPQGESFELIEVAELPLPDRLKFYFRYSILELNTAVKPWMFEWLLRAQDADRVIYLDPDIYIYGPLTEVESALASGAMMVLTPHLTGQLDDDHRPHELDIIKAGSYNLGFLALARQSSAFRFLSWWKSKLEFNCIVDHANGLFVDQKWLDLAPGMFEDVAILRHEAYNVAYWNLQHRTIVRRGDKFVVNGQPLVFYHFSGLNPGDPATISKYQDRFKLSELDGVRALVERYVGRLRVNGADYAALYRYAFGYFTNGDAIPDCIRQLYREDPEYQRSAGDNPFALDLDYLNRPLPTGGEHECPITVLMLHVWTIRPDVQRAYPRIFAEDRVRYAEWFVTSAARQMGIPSSCVTPAGQALVRLRAPSAPEAPVAPMANFQRGSIKELLQLNDVEFVMQAYHAVLQRSPDPSGFEHFIGALQSGASKVEVLWGMRYSREGRSGGVRLDGLLLRYAGARLRRFIARRGRRRTTLVPGPSRVPVPVLSESISKSLFRGPVVGPDERWATVAHRRFGRSEYTGFYDWGDEHAGLVWMGKRASVRLGNDVAGPLRLIGSYDADHQLRANGSAATTVEIVLNDRTACSFVLERSGKFDVTLNLPSWQPDAPVFLTLTAGQSFVPARIGLNADPRELSMRIARIDLNGSPVLDFGRAQSPYVGAASRAAAAGINIVGYIRSEHGIGESARLCAGSASAVGLPFVLCDFNAGNSARAEDRTWRHRITDVNPYPVNIFHINADQMTLARETLGEGFFAGRYNIGFWHWELPDFPDRFRPGFAFLDEIWVPSHFVMDAVSAKSPVPVLRMPHAVSFEVDGSARRQQFGLPEDRFLFLTMYDMHSAQGRKNPHAAIAAYRRAFHDPRSVGLVVKVQNAQSQPAEFEELKRELSDCPGIVLIDRTLSRDEVYQLEMLCDCFVSLHRSEGFGLGLAESMFLGKVVIGTNWSGNIDFMNYRNSCPVNYRLIKLERDYGPYYKKGNTWADPDVEHAAWYMAKVVSDHEWKRHIAAEARGTILTDLSRARVGALHKARLRLIGGMRR